MSETAKSGVYPCYENQFQIDTAASGATAAMKDIADCETFEVSFVTVWRNGLHLIQKDGHAD